MDSEIINSFKFYLSDSIAANDQSLTADAGIILPAPGSGLNHVSLPYSTHHESYPAKNESIAGKLLNIGGTLSLSSPFLFHQYLSDIRFSDLTSNTSNIITQVKISCNGIIHSRVLASGNIIPSDFLTRLLNAQTGPLFIFYPDNRATELTIDLPQVSRYITLPLRPHSSGCGAFWWSGFLGSTPPTSAGRLISTAEIAEEGIPALIACPNRLGTSVSGNPMIEAGSSYISDSVLLSVSASLKALSSGQLGEFPLYGFSNQGIHALRPLGDGGFQDVQLICRDIPVSPDTIIALPDATAFLSSRGLMILSSSKATLINSYPTEDSDFTGPAATDRIAYHYDSNAIILQRDDQSFIYDIDNNEWRPGSFKIRMLISILYGQNYIHICMQPPRMAVPHLLNLHLPTKSLR